MIQKLFLKILILIFDVKSSENYEKKRIKNLSAFDLQAYVYTVGANPNFNSCRVISFKFLLLLQIFQQYEPFEPKNCNYLIMIKWI